LIEPQSRKKESNMKKIAMTLAASAVLGWVNADPVLSLNASSDFLRPVTRVEVDGNHVFETSSVLLKSAKPFIFESGKTYRLKGSFRDISTASPKLYFGIIPLDADGREILPAHVTVMPNTDTELAEDAKAGDTAVKLKNAAAWKAFDRRWCIAFGAAGDGSDLPNREISPLLKEINGNEAILNQALTKNYPAGTKVRAHRTGDTYLYRAANAAPLKPQWETFSGTIQASDLRPGTKSVRIVILPLFPRPDASAKVQFKDIVLEEVK